MVLKRFAQIQNGKVHWVFEAETCPEFAPYIVIVDITGMIPAPQEGWRYEQGQFIPPSQRHVCKPKASFTDPTMAVFKGIGPELLPSHTHDQPHLLVVVRGSINLSVGGDRKLKTIMNAPSVVELPANVPHAAEGLSEDTVILSIFIT